jgi:hypothetical protein
MPELTPVRRDDEESTGNGECNASDDHSDSAHAQSWDFGGDEPDTSEEDQQESDFREA